MLWESKIELGEKFFHEIISHPVPLDMNILKALKRSSLGLDLYLWLNLPHLCSLVRSGSPGQCSTAPVRSRTRIKAGDKHRDAILPPTDCLRELKKIKIAWPALNYATAKGVLIIYPSAPSILPAQRRLLE